MSIPVSQQQPMATSASQASTSSTGSHTPLSVRDILAHKSTMFNFKLPSDRTMYESSLIYCNLCDYSCDLTDKSAIICHYLAKHPDDNIVYSYLWPQMEQNAATNAYKVKYYLIKAHLKIRTKETGGASAAPPATVHSLQHLDLDQLSFPTSLLDTMEVEEEHMIVEGEELETTEATFIMNRMLDWLDQTLTPFEQVVVTEHPSGDETGTAGAQEDVQELEEEQEVQEVEMFGEDAYDAGTSSSAPSTGTATSLDELVKLSSAASFYYSQQKLMAGGSTAATSYLLDNNYLVHLLAINKSENVFRVKQIHDYYGGCFICGLQVDFNMKHYQVSHYSDLDFDVLKLNFDYFY